MRFFFLVLVPVIVHGFRIPVMKMSTSTTLDDDMGDPIRWVPTYITTTKNPKYALDVYCGDGDSTHALYQRLSPEWNVLGVDPNPAKIAMAKERHPTLLFSSVSLDTFRSASFDRIQVHTGRMLFLSKKKQFAREMTRLLKPGGRLEIFDFSPCHPIVHEIQCLDEHVRRRYFKGWQKDSSTYFSGLLSPRHSSVAVVGQDGIVCTTLEKKLN